MSKKITLISKKLIQRLAKNVYLSSTQTDAAKEWLDLYNSGKLVDETKNYTNFQEIILESILGYTRKNVLRNEDNVEFELVDDNNNKMAVIECKGSNQGIDDNQHRGKSQQRTPFLQTVNYCTKNGIRYGICTNYKYFVLVDIHAGTSKRFEFDFTTIEKEENLKIFVTVFSRKNLILEKIVDKLFSDSIIEEADIEKAFYETYSQTRLMLINEFLENTKLEIDDAKHYSELFLNRLIFLFFIEDNGLIDSKLFRDRVFEVLKSQKVWKMSHQVTDDIIDLFQSLDVGRSGIQEIPEFNGGLFNEKIPSQVFFNDLREKPFSMKSINYDGKIKHNLGEQLDKIIGKYHRKLNPIIINLLQLDNYDFTSDINPNILGHILERSLLDPDELKINIRKTEGIYYTFDYITEFICKNTIIQYLSKNGAVEISDLIEEYYDDIDELERKVSQTKILDPACGSGAFLVKAAQILLEIYEQIKKIKLEGMNKQLTIDEWKKFEYEDFSKILLNNIYGVDKNSEAVEKTQLSMFIQLATPGQKLINLSKNIRSGNSIISDSKLAKGNEFEWEKQFPDILPGGFDIIIGNPPYGAKLTEEERNYLKKKFSSGTTDTASLFMEQAKNLLSKDGCHGFIIPKTFLYNSNWSATRKKFLDGIIGLIDCGKPWKDVKYEMAIYIYKPNSSESFYMNGTRQKSLLFYDNKIEKTCLNKFGIILTGINPKEVELGNKMLNSEKLDDNVISNVRGINRKGVTEKRIGNRVLNGKQIQRFYTNGEEGFIENKHIKSNNARVKKDSILAQNLVAHIQNPTDHLKITATIPLEQDFVILEKVNQITIIKNKISPYFVLGLLNSKLINWYVYRFLVSKAIRTIGFDRPITERIPFIAKNQSSIETIVKKLLKLYPKFVEKKDNFVVHLRAEYKLKKITEKIGKFYELDGMKIFDEIKKCDGKSKSASEQGEWFKYFKKEKDETQNQLLIIKNLESELNQEVYKIFDLTEDEIESVETTTPE